MRTQNTLKGHYNHTYQVIRANTYACRSYAFICRSIIEIDIFLSKLSIFSKLWNQSSTNFLIWFGSAYIIRTVCWFIFLLKLQLNFFMISHHSKICQKTHSKKVRLIRKQRVILVQNELTEVSKLHHQLTNKENLRFLINEWSIKLSQEVEKLKVSKKKLKEYIRRLQRTVEELEERIII